MKKYLIALAVALMVCLLGISASAETAEKEVALAEQEQRVIAQECYEIMDEIDPNGLDVKTQIQIMSNVYEEAGWTVVDETPALARAVDIDPEIWELAYSDIDNADPEQREKILSAREEVVSHYSWQNDIEFHGVGYTIDMSKKEIQFGPLYSELFPGWDPPRPGRLGGETSDTAESEQESVDIADCVAVAPVSIDSADPVGSAIKGAMIARDVPGTFVYYDSSLYVGKASSSSIASNFVTIPVASGVRNTMDAGAMSFNTAGLTSINIGFQTLPDGRYVQNFLRMTSGVYGYYDVPAADTSYVSKVGIRASTYTTAGYANVKALRTI